MGCAEYFVKLYFLCRLHAQFSGARHNFSKTSTPLVQSAQMSCDCAISSISLDVALYLSSRSLSIGTKAIFTHQFSRVFVYCGRE